LTAKIEVSDGRQMPVQ